jgi:uncharacterized protein YlxP (DUF503 family)
VVVGLATVVLDLPAAASLKDKRRVVKSVVARVRNRFNVAAAEVDTQESWGRVTLGIACVSNDAAHAHEMLAKVVAFVEDERLDAVLVDYGIELL